MSAKLVFPVICGMAALGLVAASALAPWFEWTFDLGAEPEIEQTDLWGPPAYVVGSPSGSVEMDPTGQKAINASVGVYLAALLAALAWAIPILRAASARLGPRKGSLVVVSGSLVLFFAAVVAAGLPWFLLKQAAMGAAARSTWIVPVEFLRVLPRGPAMLGVGTLLGIAALVWARAGTRISRDEALNGTGRPDQLTGS